MTILGTFDPALGPPAVAYPASVNELANSSEELGALGLVRYGVARCTVATSTANPRSGALATRITVGTGLASNAFIGARVLTYVLGSAARTISCWIYADPASQMVADGYEVRIGANPVVGPWTPLAGGWQRLSYSFTSNINDFSVQGQNDAAVGAGTYDGETIDIDDWQIQSGLTLTDWEPANGEPLFTADQSWVSSGTGSLNGLSVTPGDLVTTGIPSGEYALSVDAAWEVTEFLTDPGDALQQRPIGIQGHPIGLGDWRIVYQMLLPADPRARWGIARWGEQIWPGIAWYDVTPWVRGSSWARGSSGFGERPEIGTAQITLDNRDGYQFSPWNGVSAFQDATFVTTDGVVLPGFLGPGTVMRIVCYSPSGQTHPLTDPAALNPASEASWVPQFSGVVESWTDASVEKGADAYVNVALKETGSTLARVNSAALLAPVGADDLPEDRIQRLLDAAGWKYGPLIDQFLYLGSVPSSGEYELQGTVMAANRISEIYLTADSVGGVVRTDRSGALVLYNEWPDYLLNGIARGPEAGPITLGPSFDIAPVFGDLTVPYVADSLEVANDDEAIQNIVSLAYVGGTARTGSDTVSIGQYDQIDYSRSDLICQSDTLLDRMIASRLDARARRPLRLSALALHSHHEGALAAIVGLDVDNTVEVELAPVIPGYVSIVERASIAGYQHDVTPLPASTVVWTCQITTGLQGDLTMEEI